MPPRTPTSTPYKLADRGVYVSDFTVNGFHWVYAVLSNGEQMALRTALPRDVDAVSGILWDELDELDPIRSDASYRPSGRHLRLT